MQVEQVALGVVEGVVSGPGDIPISGAVVTATGAAREARTDHNGRFRIAGVRAGRAA